MDSIHLMPGSKTSYCDASPLQRETLNKQSARNIYEMIHRAASWVGRAPCEMAQVPPGAVTVLVSDLFKWCNNIASGVRLNLEEARANDAIVHGGHRPFEWIGFTPLRLDCLRASQVSALLRALDLAKSADRFDDLGVTGYELDRAQDEDLQEFGVELACRRRMLQDHIDMFKEIGVPGELLERGSAQSCTRQRLAPDAVPTQKPMRAQAPPVRAKSQSSRDNRLENRLVSYIRGNTNNGRLALAQMSAYYKMHPTDRIALQALKGMAMVGTLAPRIKYVHDHSYAGHGYLHVTSGTDEPTSPANLIDVDDTPSVSSPKRCNSPPGTPPQETVFEMELQAAPPVVPLRCTLPFDQLPCHNGGNNSLFKILTDPVVVEVCIEPKAAKSLAFGTGLTWAQLAESLVPSHATQQRHEAIMNLVKAELALVKCEVVLAGSSAQGTDVEGYKDIDLLVRFEDFDPNNIGKFIDVVDKLMHMSSALGPIKLKRDSMRMLKFELNDMHVDLLVGGIESDAWPSSLIELEPRLRGNLRPTYTMKTVQFVDEISKSCPYLRDVIRVAKRWRDHEIKHWENGARPKSFLITLLVVHAHLTLNVLPTGNQSAAIESGFIAFLQAILKCKELWQTWTDCGWFCQSVIPDDTKVQRPLLLDPADPSNNVADSVDKWDRLADVAGATLEKMEKERVEGIFELSAHLD